MRILLLFFALSFYSFSVFAQNNLTVAYHNTYKIISFKKQKLVDDFDRESILYTNGDSVSFYTYTNQKPEKKPATIGSKNDHHASYYFQKLQRGLAEYAWQKPFKLQEYVPLQVDWKLYEDTIHIAGYLCKVAVADGLVAWYTTEIPVSSGPPGFSGLPGLILMVEDHRYKQLIKAASVKFESPRIVLPDLKLETCTSCESKLEEIRKYFAD